MLPDIPIQYDAFISYARADGDDSASRLENALRPAFKTWRDTRGIDPAKDFTAEIEMAIRASKFVVTCITPDTARADSFVRREIQWALTINKPVIVARFDAATPPPIHVVNNTWVEFHKDWDTALTHLTGILRKEPDDYDRPALPPETADPFRPYVQAVYEYIVRFLDQAVIRLIDLTSEATTDAVHTPPAPVPARRGMMDQFFTAQGLPSPDSAGETAPTEEITTFTKFADAFEHYSGRVLLLGEPGAGKTITLFSHARETITRRLADPSAPLPLLGLVATWNAREQTPLADWLAAGYEDLPREEVARIIDVGRALLLLDGLDELGSEQEEERENPETGNPEKIRFDPRPRFLNTIPANNQVIVSCRVKDYAEIGQKIALNGAVTLQPLSEVQMHAYLAEQPDLLAAIEADADLKAMLSTPLIMSLFAFAYKDLTPEDAVHLRDLAASPGDLRDAIIKRYVRERYAWEDRKHGPLAFSLDEIDEVLGRAAMENVIGGWWVEENVLHSRILGLDVGCLSVFTTLAVQLNLLAPERYNYWRFVHLLLRDYFAFGYALPHLHDAHRSARRSAAKALGQLGDARAVAPLIAALRDDVDAVVRLTVPIALMRIGTPEALVAIVRCGSWGDSIRAVHKLECIGEPSVAGLIAVLRVAKERLIRLAAAEALEKIGTPEALAAVNAFRRGEIKPDTE